MVGTLGAKAIALGVSLAILTVGGMTRSQDKLQVVETVGCLTGAKDAWALTKAARPYSATAAAGAEVPLGDGTFRLIGISLFKPSEHAGHKVRVQGLQIQDALNVTSLTMVSRECNK